VLAASLRRFVGAAASLDVLRLRPGRVLTV
jgi:hypothetical protein